MAELKDGSFHTKLLETQRLQQRKAFEESLAKLEEQTKKDLPPAPMEQRFAFAEEVKKSHIVGLVSLDEYKRKREGLVDEPSTKSSSGILYTGPGARAADVKSKDKTPKAKKPKVEKSKLSFDVEEEESESFQVIPKKREEKTGKENTKEQKESTSETSSPKTSEKNDSN